jgi:hypothetical protein
MREHEYKRFQKYHAESMNAKKLYFLL